MDISFALWLNENRANEIMDYFREIFDQFGNKIRDIGPEGFRSKFERQDKNKIYLKGFQGYKQHNPMIQSFANQSPENFAQTLLFGPLTANTSFARFNEWFPVLMHFLRKHDQVTPEMVGNFAASIHSQQKGIPGGGLFVSIIDRGERHKTQLISHVWNNREQIKTECDELAKDGRYRDLMHKFSTFPGIQPVKAGFIVQLLYGHMGCLDTHNIAMYTDLANQMQNDPSLDKTTREKWKELGHKFKAGQKTWIKAAGAQDWQLDRSVDAYHDILKFMDKELGFNPRVLWDLWCNYVAQRYSPKKAYSLDQGIAYSPDDEELHNVLGGKDRQWTNPKTRVPTNIIRPHLASGAVSRVHLMAAITPDALLDELERIGNNKFHIYNAAARQDKNVKAALQVLSNRMHDMEEIKAMIDVGGRVNSAIRSSKEHNLMLLDRLTKNAMRTLQMTLQHKYPTLKGNEAEEMVNIYVNGFARLYKIHTKEILTSLKGQDTMMQKNRGVYVADDEEEGYGKYHYDPDSAFNIKSKNPDVQKRAQSRTNVIGSRMEPYEPELMSSAQSSLLLKKTQIELTIAQNKMKQMKEQWKTQGYDSFGGKEKYVKKRDKLAEKIKELKDRVEGLHQAHKKNMGKLSTKAGAEIEAQSKKLGDRLHRRNADEEIPDEEYYDDEEN